MKIKHFIIFTIISTLLCPSVTFADDTIETRNDDQNAVRKIKPIRIFSRGQKADPSLWIGMEGKFVDVELPKHINEFPVRRIRTNQEPILFSLEHKTKSLKERLKELFHF